MIIDIQIVLQTSPLVMIIILFVTFDMCADGPIA